jgi:serine/threonine-protein kinase HipA
MPATSCVVFSCADPENPIPIGRFALDDAGQGRFGYGLKYLKREDAFELDPVHLPLTSSEISVPRRNDDTFGVLSDAGPNTWGAQLALRLLRESQMPPPGNAIDWFLTSGYYGSGCLGFSSDPQMPPHPGPVPSSSASLSGRILRALDAYITDPDAHLDVETATLLFPGSSLGGIRPKTVVMHEGREYIAKFSRPDDRFDVPAVEYATLRLALDAGVDLPDFELKEIKGRSVLLVERFDRTGDGRRIHYISAHSLLNPAHLSPDGREYKTSFSYAGIAEVLRPFGHSPRRDAHELYRRMVLNIMVGNVDDHLRNHAFLMASPGRYRLSPAFDIVPHIEAPSRPQTIGVGAFGPASTIRNALSQCGRFLLSEDEAWTIITEVKEAVSRWRSVFADSGVSEQDIYTLTNCFRVAGEPVTVQVPVKNDIVAWPVHLQAVHGELGTGYERVETEGLKGYQLDYALAVVWDARQIRLDYFPGLRAAKVSILEQEQSQEFVKWSPSTDLSLATRILQRFGLPVEDIHDGLLSLVLKRYGKTIDIPVPKPVRSRT